MNPTKKLEKTIRTYRYILLGFVASYILVVIGWFVIGLIRTFKGLSCPYVIPVLIILLMVPTTLLGGIIGSIGSTKKVGFERLNVKFQFTVSVEIVLYIFFFANIFIDYKNLVGNLVNTFLALNIVYLVCIYLVFVVVIGASSILLEMISKKHDVLIKSIVEEGGGGGGEEEQEEELLNTGFRRIYRDVGFLKKYKKFGWWVYYAINMTVYVLGFVLLFFIVGQLYSIIVKQSSPYMSFISYWNIVFMVIGRGVSELTKSNSKRRSQRKIIRIFKWVSLLVLGLHIIGTLLSSILIFALSCGFTLKCNGANLSWIYSYGFVLYFVQSGIEILLFAILLIWCIKDTRRK